MTKKSIILKSMGCAFTTAVVVGAFTSAQDRFTPRTIDTSAFKNAATNITFLASQNTNKEEIAVTNVTGDIINVIEKEIKGKIKVTRSQIASVDQIVTPKKVTKILAKAKTLEIKYPVVAKNWSDIKPQFRAVDYKVSAQAIARLALAEESSSGFEINNKDLIKLYHFEIQSHPYDRFGNSDLAEFYVKDDMREDTVSTSMAANLKELTQEEAAELAEFIAEETKVVTAAIELAPTTLTEQPKAKIEDMVSDEVSVLAAAPIKDIQNISEKQLETIKGKVGSTASEVIVEEAKDVAIVPVENDDLVVFDYSEKSEHKTKKIFDLPISSSVKEVIARESHRTGYAHSYVSTQKKRVPQAEVTTDKDLLDQALIDADQDPNTVAFEYSTPQGMKSSKSTIEEATSAFMTGPENKATQRDFTIKAKEINLNTQKVKSVFGYEFIPDYDRVERADDQASGEIKIAYTLTEGVNTQMGVVQSHGLIPTRVELNLLNMGMSVPLLNDEGIQRFLQKRNLDIVGNLIMIAIDSSILDIELDSDFQAKLYLTKNFKATESKESASYVLFAGVKSGNILMRYLLNNKESAQKIVYVGDGEMYYEDPDFKNTARDVYTFTTRSLLGKRVKELNIDGSLVSFFGTKNFSKKKALNAYEIKVPEMVYGSRKYLEFKHLGASLFVGSDNKNVMEIPGQDFIAKVLQVNDLSELGNRCMVQVNLSARELRDFKVSGKNSSGEMFVETSFLDNDGNFTRDSSELAEKIFISGDQEGVFNARLDYTDGSTEFLKTFCSEGSYIVEQL
jgi:hypothetical protein